MCNVGPSSAHGGGDEKGHPRVRTGFCQALVHMATSFVCHIYGSSLCHVMPQLSGTQCVLCLARHVFFGFAARFKNGSSGRHCNSRTCFRRGVPVVAISLRPTRSTTFFRRKVPTFYIHTSLLRDTSRKKVVEMVEMVEMPGYHTSNPTTFTNSYEFPTIFPTIVFASIPTIETKTHHGCLSRKPFQTLVNLTLLVDELHNCLTSFLFIKPHSCFFRSESLIPSQR